MCKQVVDNNFPRFGPVKLSRQQGALEAVTREDFEPLHEMSSQMIARSHKEIWEQMASPRFVQDTADFMAAVEFMDRMATAREVAPMYRIRNELRVSHQR